MKALIASVFALGLLGASAVPANAITVTFGTGYHHHGWHHGYYRHHYWRSGWGWRHHYRHHYWHHHY